MGTYTSRHLFAKMFLLYIPSFGVESSEPQMLFAPSLRPRHETQGLAPGIVLWCLSVFVGNEDTLNKWNSEAIIKKVQGMRSMAMGLPSSAYWPVRSFVALFIRKHGTLDEHCKHQSCDRDCWAYHNMLGTSNQLSLSARSPPVQKTIHIPVQRAPLQVALVQEILNISACVYICVWHHVFFGNTSPVTCFGSHFLQVRYCDLKWFAHISISGQRCLCSAPYDMIKNVPPDASFVHMTWYGSNLGLHKVGRLKMI